MEKPGDNDEIRSVAVLRTIRKTQDEVADILKMGKYRVGKIDQWLKNEPYDSVASLFTHHLLKRVVDEKLVENEISPVDLVQAARLTIEQILEHYDQRPPGMPTETGNLKLSEEHQADLIQFANELIPLLDPHLWAFPLRAVGTLGEHSISTRTWTLNNNYSLSWRVDHGNIVSLIYGPESSSDNKTRIIYGYFKQHLQSSSYTWLIESEERGINRWRYLGGEGLKRRAHLLRQIDRDLTKLTGKPLTDPSLMHDVGPFKWFSESIWSAALDRLYRTLDYKTEAADGGLFKAWYGPNILGLVVTRDEAEEYIGWHQQLMAKYARSKAVKAIIQLAKESEEITESIREVLTRWVVDRHIPGKCDYEFCCG
jgi:hypothetical protein